MLSRIAVGFVCLVGVVLGTMLCTPLAAAQMQLGTVSTPASLGTCPPGLNFDRTMACWSAAVSCPNTESIGIIYGVSTPGGHLKGTIVMLSGDGGVGLPGTFAGQQPSFNYPKTAISGWLCQSVSNLEFKKWNNSAPQGQLFFQEFASASDTAILSVNGVSGCLSNENVESGTITYAGVNYGGTSQPPAYDAIIIDMTTDSSVSQSCVTAGQNRQP